MMAVGFQVFLMTFSTFLQLTALARILTRRKFHRTPHFYVAHLLLLGLVQCCSHLLALILESLELDSSYGQWYYLAAQFGHFGMAFNLLALSLDSYFRTVHSRLGIPKCNGLAYLPVLLCISGLAFLAAFLEMSSRMDCDDVSFLAMSGLVAVATDLFFLRTCVGVRTRRRMGPVSDMPHIIQGWTVTPPATATLNIATNSLAFVHQGDDDDDNNDDDVRKRIQSNVLSFNFRLNLLFQLCWIPNLLFHSFAFCDTSSWLSMTWNQRANFTWLMAVSCVQDTFQIAMPILWFVEFGPRRQA